MTAQPPGPTTAPEGAAEAKPRPQGSLLRATVWTLAGEAAAHPIRVIASLVLTRLLVPEHFGLMAVVQVFMTGLNMFSDLGVRTIIIRHPKGEDPGFLDTIWTVRLVRGIILGVALCALSWPVSIFYGQPLLAWLFPIASLNLVLEGLLSTKVYTYDKRLSRGRPTLVTLVSSIIGVAFMIAWAWKYRTVWSLAWGGVVGTGIRVLLSHVALPGRGNRFHWDRAAWSEVAQFGKWIFLNSVVTFLAVQLDKLVFAKLFRIEDFGLYAIAVNIVQLPTAMMHTVASSVAFPAFSRANNEKGDLAGIFDRMRLLLAFGGGACISFLIFTGPWVISILYDYRYEAAGRTLQLLAFGAWFMVLEFAHGYILMTLGHPRWLTLANAVKIAVMIVAVPLAFHGFGLTGALVVLSIVEAVPLLLNSRRVAREGLKRRTYEWAGSLVVLGGGAAAMTIQKASFLPLGVAARTFLTGALFVAIWAPLTVWSLRKLRKAA